MDLSTEEKKLSLFNEYKRAVNTKKLIPDNSPAMKLRKKVKMFSAMGTLKHKLNQVTDDKPINSLELPAIVG